jgi:hypothetical protein
VTITSDRNTSGAGAEKLTRLTQDVSCRVLRIPYAFQLARQTIEEPEGD